MPGRDSGEPHEQEGDKRQMQCDERRCTARQPKQLPLVPAGSVDFMADDQGDGETVEKEGIPTHLNSRDPVCTWREAEHRSLLRGCCREFGEVATAPVSAEVDADVG